jgi:hypothetical protein
VLLYCCIAVGVVGATHDVGRVRRHPVHYLDGPAAVKSCCTTAGCCIWDEVDQVLLPEYVPEARPACSAPQQWIRKWSYRHRIMPSPFSLVHLSPPYGQPLQTAPSFGDLLTGFPHVGVTYVYLDQFIRQARHCVLSHWQLPHRSPVSGVSPLLPLVLVIPSVYLFYVHGSLLIRLELIASC